MRPPGAMLHCSAFLVVRILSVSSFAIRLLALSRVVGLQGILRAGGDGGERVERGRKQGQTLLTQ